MGTKAATSVFRTYQNSGGRVSSTVRLDENIVVEGPAYDESRGHFVTVSDRSLGLTSRHYGSRVDLAAWMAFAEGFGRTALSTLDMISSSAEVLGEAVPIMHHRNATCWAGECHLIYNGHAEELRVYIPGFYDETLDVRDASPINFQQVAQLKFGANPEDWLEGIPFEFGEQAPPEGAPESATDLDPDTIPDTSAADLPLPPEDLEDSVLIGQTIRFQDKEGNVKEGQVVDEDGERLQVRTSEGMEEITTDQIVGEGIDLTPEEEEEEESDDLAALQAQIMGDSDADDEAEADTEVLLQQAELLTSEISHALAGSGSAVARKAGRVSARAGSLPKKRKKKPLEDEVDEDFTTGDVPTLDVPLGLIRGPDVQPNCPEGQQFNVLTGECDEIPEQAKGFRGFRLAMQKQTQKTPGMTMVTRGEA